MANSVFPPRVLTFPTWQNEVEAVLLEVEPGNLPQRLEVAKAAVTLRLKGLLDDPDGQLERVAIADAKKLIVLIQEVNAVLEAKQQGRDSQTVREETVGCQGTLDALSGTTLSQGYLRSITAENLRRRAALVHVTEKNGTAKYSAA
jgi:hypothetical protein